MSPLVDAHSAAGEYLTVAGLRTFVRDHGDGAPVVEEFTKPWTMRPFEVPWVGEAWLGSMVAPAFTALMYRIGIADREIAPPEEVAIHLELLKHSDRGRAFLKIMRCFETNAGKQLQYLETLGAAGFPMQAIWGKDDPALRLDVQGAHIRAIVGDDAFHAVEGLHFVQETQAPLIAERIAALAG